MKLSEKHITAIKNWISDKGLSQREVADIVGVKGNQAVRAWLNGGGIRMPQWRKLEPLIQQYLEPTEIENKIPFELKKSYEALKTILASKELLWVTEQYLRNTAALVKEYEIISKEKNTVKKFIDFPDFKVSAGGGIINDALEKAYPERSDIDRLTVSGESMLPKFKNGDRILVHRFSEPIIFAEDYLPEHVVKSFIPDGSIIIYDLNDSGLSMKKIRYKNSGSTWLLIFEAENKEWGNDNGFPRVLQMDDDLRIYGKVIGKDN